MEPTSTAAGALLAKYSVAIAGFAGAILSLSFLRGLTRKQAGAAVVTGFLSSIFTTQLVVAYFGLPNDAESKNGVAFLIGLLAMNVIPGLKAFAERFLTPRGA
ncbi:peptidase M48, Ste24p [Pseudomonas nitroreducens]|uniref:Peptidase M48, Ste24p n=2 Tax=Pseudomonas nitroreducens TaxID=46680 RepID=A0A6G6IYC6_PSENT|nr:peptidase M48, Ste24p [Pseudomonas nitroreducens]QIE87994.1 peptidase M48, Ste24p [Pseudomonas nitroreducens]